MRSNSGELIHQLVRGHGPRAALDLGHRPGAQERQIKVVLPQYRGSSNVAIHAVYPCREFMPAKVDVFIDFLAELYAPEPYWDKGLDLHKLAPHAGAPKVKSRGDGQRCRSRGGSPLTALHPRSQCAWAAPRALPYAP